MKEYFFGAFLHWSALFYWEEYEKMNVYRVAFIGHRKIDEKDHLIAPTDGLIKGILQSKDFVEFYIGGKGDFDLLTTISAKLMQNEMRKHNSRIVYIQPYHTNDDDFYERCYDKVLYPTDCEWDPKTVITQRNRWMIDHADLLVAYAESDRAGEAMKALQYAKKKGLKIINLAI